MDLTSPKHCFAFFVFQKAHLLLMQTIFCYFNPILDGLFWLV